MARRGAWRERREALLPARSAHGFPPRGDRGGARLRRRLLRDRALPLPRAPRLRRLAPDGEGAVHEEEEERDHGEDADEAELLRDHREEEIRVRFGQVEELLDARAKPHAEPFTP